MPPRAARRAGDRRGVPAADRARAEQRRAHRSRSSRSSRRPARAASTRSATSSTARRPAPASTSSTTPTARCSTSARRATSARGCARTSTRTASGRRSRRRSTTSSGSSGACSARELAAALEEIALIRELRPPAEPPHAARPSATSTSTGAATGSSSAAPRRGTARSAAAPTLSAPRGRSRLPAGGVRELARRRAPRQPPPAAWSSSSTSRRDLDARAAEPRDRLARAHRARPRSGSSGSAASTPASSPLARRNTRAYVARDGARDGTVPPTRTGTVRRGLERTVPWSRPTDLDELIVFASFLDARPPELKASLAGAAAGEDEADLIERRRCTFGGDAASSARSARRRVSEAAWSSSGPPNAWSAASFSTELPDQETGSGPARAGRRGAGRMLDRCRRRARPRRAARASWRRRAAVDLPHLSAPWRPQRSRHGSPEWTPREGRRRPARRIGRFAPRRWSASRERRGGVRWPRPGGRRSPTQARRDVRSPGSRSIAVGCSRRGSSVVGRRAEDRELGVARPEAGAGGDHRLLESRNQVVEERARSRAAPTRSGNSRKPSKARRTSARGETPG